MKNKILILLFVVSLVAGMIIPTTAAKSDKATDDGGKPINTGPGVDHGQGADKGQNPNAGQAAGKGKSADKKGGSGGESEK